MTIEEATAFIDKTAYTHYGTPVKILGVMEGGLATVWVGGAKGSKQEGWCNSVLLDDLISRKPKEISDEESREVVAVKSVPGITRVEVQAKPFVAKVEVNDAQRSAFEALTKLGYKSEDAEKAITSAAQVLGASAGVEALIKKALG